MARTKKDELVEDIDNEEVVEEEDEIDPTSEEEEEEVYEDEEIEEDTAASTLKPNSKPVNDPKSRIEMMKNVIGAMASASSTELTKWNDQALALIGKEARLAPDAEGKNKESISAKPSDAQGSKDGSGTFKMPMPKLNVKEDLKAVFDGDKTLTEEAKDQIETLFEAAVQAKVILEREEMKAELIEDADKKFDEVVEELIEQVNGYLAYVTEQWMEDNQVAIDNALKVEIVKEFVEKQRDLLESCFIDLDDDSVTVVEGLHEEVETLEGKLNEAIDQINELKGVKLQVQLDAVVDELSEGLTDTQAEKFENLLEAIEFDSVDTFKKKALMVKENFITNVTEEKNDKTSDDLDTINEDGEVEEQVVDPRMQKYLGAFAKRS